MIVPAPMLWLVTPPGNERCIVAPGGGRRGRASAVLTLGVSLWWIAMLVIQGRFGAEVLAYSESLADVSLTRRPSPEVWRSLGYWLFYVRDPYAATTTASLRLPVSPVVDRRSAICCRSSCLAGLVVGAVGASPVRRAAGRRRASCSASACTRSTTVAADATARRSTTRSGWRSPCAAAPGPLPVMNLGLALLAGALVARLRRCRLAPAGVACRRRARRRGRRLLADRQPAVAVDRCLRRPGARPRPGSARGLDRRRRRRSTPRRSECRVLQLPGRRVRRLPVGLHRRSAAARAHRQPLVTRDLLPLGSAGGDGPAVRPRRPLPGRRRSSLPSIGAGRPRWLGVDTVWVTNDLAFDRFRTARPQTLTDAGRTARPASARPCTSATPSSNEPDGADDRRAARSPTRASTAAGRARRPRTRSSRPARSCVPRTAAVVVSGSGDGLVDAAAAGLLDGRRARPLQRVARRRRARRRARRATRLVVVTDSNRDRARHWRSSQDTTGLHRVRPARRSTLLRDVAADDRLAGVRRPDEPVDPATQTVARQDGPVTATATVYGEPFAYLPEHRPYMAIDGDPTTAWTVGEHADPIGETLRLRLRPAGRPRSRCASLGAGSASATSASVERSGRRRTATASSARRAVRSAEGSAIDLADGATTVDDHDRRRRRCRSDGGPGARRRRVRRDRSSGCRRRSRSCAPACRRHRRARRRPAAALVRPHAAAYPADRPLAQRPRADAGPRVRAPRRPVVHTHGHGARRPAGRRRRAGRLFGMAGAVPRRRLTGVADGRRLGGDRRRRGDVVDHAVRRGGRRHARRSTPSGAVDDVTVDAAGRRLLPDHRASRVAGGERVRRRRRPAADAAASSTIELPDRCRRAPVEVEITADRAARPRSTAATPTRSSCRRRSRAVDRHADGRRPSTSTPGAATISWRSTAEPVPVQLSTPRSPTCSPARPSPPSRAAGDGRPRRRHAPVDDRRPGCRSAGRPRRARRRPPAAPAGGARRRRRRSTATSTDRTQPRRSTVDGCPDGCWLVLGEGYNDGWSATTDGRRPRRAAARRRRLQRLVDRTVRRPGRRCTMRWTAQTPADHRPASSRRWPSLACLVLVAVRPSQRRRRPTPPPARLRHRRAARCRSAPAGSPPWCGSSPLRCSSGRAGRWSPPAAAARAGHRTSDGRGSSGW